MQAVELKERILSDAVVAAVDHAYAFIDLEVDPATHRIFRLGLVSADASGDYLGQAHLQHALARLRNAKMNSRLHVCGHNFSRFDRPYLEAEWPELRDWPVIDTLELSLLAFPWQYSHRLSKDYKESRYSTNNPLEDAEETRALLYRILNQLASTHAALRSAYVWLLTCGDTLADRAYQRLFGLVGWNVDEAPAFSSLPQEAVVGLDTQECKRFLRAPNRKDFDERLCVAGILAWNADSSARSARTLSAWMAHLAPFQRVLDALRPLQPQGFTYQPYLQYFGHDGFRGKQEEAVRAILDHKNPLILMPTGGGKSLCYQLPALMLHMRQSALTVVISPLQALMEDQVRDLEEKGLTFATFINGTLSSMERQERMDQLWQGEKGLLYISPEQLRSFSMHKLLRERMPALWVIDEAHCVSQWGHDFRTDYLYMPKFLHELQGDPPDHRRIPLALVTATATHEVREDIQQVFAAQGFPISVTIHEGMQRSNLAWQVVTSVENKDLEVVRLVREHSASGGAVLVYTTTRKRAEHLAAQLCKQGIVARHFHARVAREEKHEILEQFKSGMLNVVTATCAFGMGINRPDVRAVIHDTMSANLEGYVQEAGRAGRDDAPAACVLLYNADDADTIFYLDSLKRVSEVELGRIFEATRKVRDRVFASASEEWFWVTTNDVLALDMTSSGNSSAQDEEERRNTKVKVALHYLEQFSLTERQENLSTYIKFELACATVDEAIARFNQYATQNHLSVYQVEAFTRLIAAMYAAKSALASGDSSPSIEGLSEEAQIPAKELVNRIQTLQEAQVCRYDLPLTLHVRKGVRSAQSGVERDAKRVLSWLQRVERALLRVVQERMEERGTPTIRLHLRVLAQQMNAYLGAEQQIRATTLREILESWAARRWLKVRQVGKDEVVVSAAQLLQVDDDLALDHQITSAIVDSIYATIASQSGPQTGARLRVQLELPALAADVNQRLAPLATTAEALNAALLTLHRNKVIRIVDGLQFFQQALRVRIIARASVAAIHRSYPVAQAHYAAQTRRTHIMLHYGTLPDAERRAQFVSD